MPTVRRQCLRKLARYVGCATTASTNECRLALVCPRHFISLGSHCGSYRGEGCSCGLLAHPASRKTGGLFVLGVTCTVGRQTLGLLHQCGSRLSLHKRLAPAHALRLPTPCAMGSLLEEGGNQPGRRVCSVSIAHEAVPCMFCNLANQYYCCFCKLGGGCVALRFRKLSAREEM